MQERNSSSRSTDARIGRGRGAYDDPPRFPSFARLHGRQAGVRRRRLRSLHGGPGGSLRRGQADLPADQQLHRSPADVRRPRDRDGGGPGAGSRSTRCRRTWCEQYGSQCGYCTPGFVDVALRGLLSRGLPRRAAAQRPAQRQSLPLHGLSPDPRRRAGRPGPARRRAGGRRADPFLARLGRRFGAVRRHRLLGAAASASSGRRRLAAALRRS